MSQSIQEPPFGADVYYYMQEDRKSKKMKKVRVRISEKIGAFYRLQRVRDGYIMYTLDLSDLIKE